MPKEVLPKPEADTHRFLVRRPETARCLFCSFSFVLFFSSVLSSGLLIKSAHWLQIGDMTEREQTLENISGTTMRFNKNQKPIRSFLTHAWDSQ